MIYMPVPEKRCTKCGQWQPMSTEYFSRTKKVKSNLMSQCKDCIRQYRQAEYQDNAERYKTYSQQWRRSHPERVKRRTKNWRNANPDKVKAMDKRKHEKHKDKIAARQKKYYVKNKDDLRDYQRQYQPIWRLRNPDKTRAAKLRRRAKEHDLPNTFTAEQWERAQHYFNYRCAVCDNQLNGLFHKASADHWIPVTDLRSDNPGSSADNIVPLCHGRDGCNNSKADRDPVEWLDSKFGKRKAAKILKRINAYFDWVRSQDSEHP